MSVSASRLVQSTIKDAVLEYREKVSQEVGEDYSYQGRNITIRPSSCCLPCLCLDKDALKIGTVISIAFGAITLLYYTVESIGMAIKYQNRIRQVDVNTAVGADLKIVLQEMRNDRLARGVSFGLMAIGVGSLTVIIAVCFFAEPQILGQTEAGVFLAGGACVIVGGMIYGLNKALRPSDLFLQSLESLVQFSNNDID